MIVSTLVSSVVTHLWQTTAVVAVAWVALHTVLRHLPARLRFSVWLAVSLKFFVPFGVLTAAGAAIGARLPLSDVDSVPLTAMVELVTGSTSVTLPNESNPPAAAESAVPLSLLVFGWLAGSTIVLFRWCAEWLQIARMLRHARWIGTRDGVDILESATLRDAGCEPGVFGVIKPVVLIPADIADYLTPSQLDAVLDHECCHVRRRDNLTAAGHALVEAVFWFHPIVWWLGRELRIERERACDDAVLRRGVDSTAYAEGILMICRLYVEQRLTTIAAVTGAGLRRRIERIVAGAVEPAVTRPQRVLLGAAAALVLMVPVAHGVIGHAQQVNDPVIARMDATDTFEFASVKQNLSGDGQRGIGFQAGGRFRARNMTVRGIIAAAYGLPQPLPMFRVVGGPNWIDSDRYDVDAAARSEVAGTLTPPWPPRGQSMLRALLIDRFAIAVRQEMRNLPAYELVLARPPATLGRQLRISTGTDCVPAPTASGNAASSGVAVIACGGFGFTPPQVNGRYLTMDQLARFLTLNVVERPVINRTALPGYYSWDLEFVRGLTTAPVGPGDPSAPAGPSIFTALTEQLGLKLEPTTAPLDVVVVDAVNRPTPN